ncbi:MAG: class I SAM-dependent methyltransferase [Chloroflexota bacterium]
MDSATAARLIQLNRDFYDRFGADFSATRQRLQPGVTRLLPTFARDASILDLGCGNGELVRALARNGHRGSYLGLDFSVPLLTDASALPEGFDVKFMEVDLISAWALNVQRSTFNVITCFATLHHIPSAELRLHLLKTVSTILAPNGRFILSNWQFLNSAKLRARIQPWERIGLTSADVDAGDYLLDWRRGGEGLRYAHQFSEEELAELARESGFEIVEAFYSDGEGGRLGLYQIWKIK